MSAVAASLRSYAELTKPRILPLVLFTGLPPILMATSAVSPGWAVATPWARSSS